MAEQALYIARDNPPAAARFIDAVASTIQFAVDHPQAGKRYPVHASSLQGLRRVPVQGFGNWLVFYLECYDGLLIIRVLHGARDIPAALEE